ncbi:MAG TPA: hypothetical protein VEC11_02295 [Allosphingosinicella sp.]|nr:hypothetical protein [Allosphingosinicella sp.]
MINRMSFAMLALGALLFAAVFYAATTYNILGWTAESTGDESVWLGPPFKVALYTIAFGLPYALYELTRRTNVLAILFLIILVPAVHYGAISLFLWWIGEGAALAPAIDEMGQEIAPTVSPAVIGGLLAGFAGAAVSFFLLVLLRLRAPTAGPIVFLAGLLLLTAWGGAGLWLLGETPEAKDVVLKLFLPWQLIFAFFLSALLRASPPRGTAATTD